MSKWIEKHPYLTAALGVLGFGAASRRWRSPEAVAWRQRHGVLPTTSYYDTSVQVTATTPAGEEVTVPAPAGMTEEQAAAFYAKHPYEAGIAAGTYAGPPRPK